MAIEQPELVVAEGSILADAALVGPFNSGDDATVANAMNANAAPSFYVYKVIVSIGEVGDAINATELAGLTTVNTTRRSCRSCSP